MMPLQARVLGLEELKRTFAQLPGEFGKKVLRRGGSAGAKVVKTAVVAATPIRTGRLRAAAITKFAREKSSDEQATYIVTFRQGKKQQQVKRGRGKGARLVNLDAYYAKFVERGHRIVPRSRRIGTYRGKALYAQSKRARRANATGRVPGRYFFAGALRRSQAAALRAMVDTMTVEAKKVLRG